MEKIPKPNALNMKSSNLRHSWKLFSQQWKNYEIASGLNEEESEKRTATFLTITGTDALEVYNTFHWENAGDEVDLDKVTKKFQEYCTPKVNITYERYVFNSRRQKSSETIDEYVTALKLLSESCEFGNLKESLIKDIMILGIHDERLREILLRECNLTLEGALNIARSSERAKKQFNVISNKESQNDDEIQVNKLNKNKVFKKKTNSGNKGCWFCGTFHVYGDRANKCPAYGKVCSKCKQRNHFAKVCKQKMSNEISDENNDEDLNLMEECYIE